MKYHIEQHGQFRGEAHFAIYRDGHHPDDGHPWAAEMLTASEADWLCDMLNTSDELAAGLLAFIADHPDASWIAIRMGWAMTQGVSFESAAVAVHGARLGKE